MWEKNIRKKSGGEETRTLKYLPCKGSAVTILLHPQKRKTFIFFSTITK